MNQIKKVLLIMGSVRMGRICPQIAQWLITQAKITQQLNIEIIDLKEWDLPMDDESAIPATGHYAQNHTKLWSEKVNSADGIIFLTPQYNWGYPAVLKNAIDHLFKEWENKPAMIVSYGGHGGTKCSLQLKQVLESLSMQLTEILPTLVLPKAVIRENAPCHPDSDFKDHQEQLTNALQQLEGLIITNKKE